MKNRLVVVNSEHCAGNSVIIHKCVSSSIYILGAIENLQIFKCRNIKLYSIIKGHTVVKDTTGDLTLFTKRLIMHSGVVNGFLCVLKRTVLHGGTLKVLPPNMWHQGLGSELEAAGINMKKNQWNAATVFAGKCTVAPIENYLVTELPYKSRTLSVIDDSDLMHNSLPGPYKSYIREVNSILATSCKLMGGIRFRLKLEADILNRFTTWMEETGKKREVADNVNIAKDVEELKIQC
jgi:hypothetical protein